MNIYMNILFHITLTSSFSSWLEVTGNDRTAMKERKKKINISFNDSFFLSAAVNL